MASNSKSAGGGSVSGGTDQSGTNLPLVAGSKQGLLLAALPLRAGHLPMSELIDLYFQHYSGRDKALIQRLSWWSARLGSTPLHAVEDDHVHEALELLAGQRGRYFAGFDADGNPIHKPKSKPIAPATVNRYQAALGAVITWAIRKRIAPKGYMHPCRTLQRRNENNCGTRFLSDEERIRLLDACSRSRWSKLRLLVLLALTTGARKGELISLRWCDIDFERRLAHCRVTKNGDPKVLPLVPQVAEMLLAARSADSALVFSSTRRPGKAFDFKGVWVSALKEANIRKFRFHDLRHSCASILAKNGATLLEIADVLGHRQLQMTKRYSHLTTDHKSALINRILGNVHG